MPKIACSKLKFLQKFEFRECCCWLSRLDYSIKKTYVKYTGVIAKSMVKKLNSIGDNDERLEFFENGSEISFWINKNFETEVVLTDINGKPKTISFCDFANRLGYISSSSYLTGEPWVEVMHKMWLLAANLLARKDITPRIVNIGQSYRIIWQPAMLSAEVRQVVKSVTRSVPAVVSVGNRVVDNGGEWLLWNLLNAMVAEVGEVQYVHDTLFNLFFLDEPQRFDKIGQGGVAGGIKVWTDKFFLIDETVKFGIHVEEKDPGFAVNIFVSVQSGATIDRPIPFSYFIDNPDFRSQ